MLPEIFLTWCVETVLATTHDTVAAAFSATDQQKILDRMLAKVRSQLPEGDDADQLVEALRMHLGRHRPHWRAGLPEPESVRDDDEMAPCIVTAYERICVVARAISRR